jgi:hypothetical protein
MIEINEESSVNRDTYGILINHVKLILVNITYFMRLNFIVSIYIIIIKALFLNPSVNCSEYKFLKA